jgi:hypothetical protein
MNGIVSALLAAWLLATQTTGDRARPLSVCDLIEHRVTYNRRVVTLRGEVKWGPHGDWLASSSVCQYKLTTKGVEWPAVIALAYPNNHSSDPDDHARFSVDWASIAKDKEELRRAGFNPDTDRLYETYVGLFVTYPDLENRVNPGIRDFERLGFGPLPLGAPAQLLIKEVVDPAIVHPAK